MVKSIRDNKSADCSMKTAVGKQSRSTSELAADYEIQTAGREFLFERSNASKALRNSLNPSNGKVILVNCKVRHYQKGKETTEHVTFYMKYENMIILYRTIK